MKYYTLKNILRMIFNATATMLWLIFCAALIAASIGLCAWAALWLGHTLPVPPAR